MLRSLLSIIIYSRNYLTNNANIIQNFKTAAKKQYHNKNIIVVTRFISGNYFTFMLATIPILYNTKVCYLSLYLMTTCGYNISDNC